MLAGLDVWFPHQGRRARCSGRSCRSAGAARRSITAQLGVVIALPDLIIALLGSVEILLPTPDDAVLSLRMDVLGAVDVPAGDSSSWRRRCTTPTCSGIFELSGDMGFYLRAVRPAAVRALGRRLSRRSSTRRARCRRGCSTCGARARPSTLGEGVEVVLDVLRRRHLEHAAVRRAVPARGERRGAAHHLHGARAGSASTCCSCSSRSSSSPAPAPGVSISAGDKELFGVDLSRASRGPRAVVRHRPRVVHVLRASTSTSASTSGTRPGGEPREIHDVGDRRRDRAGGRRARGRRSSRPTRGRAASMTERRAAGGPVGAARPVRSRLRQSVAPLNRDDDGVRRVRAGDRPDRRGPTSRSAVGRRRRAGVARRLVRACAVRPARRRRAAVVAVVRADDRRACASATTGSGSAPTSAASARSVCRAPEESIFPDHRREAVGSRQPGAARPPRREHDRTVDGRAARGDLTTTTPSCGSRRRRADAALGRRGRSALTYADGGRSGRRRAGAERTRLRVTPSHAACGGWRHDRPAPPPVAAAGPRRRVAARIPARARWAPRPCRSRSRSPGPRSRATSACSRPHRVAAVAPARSSAAIRSPGAADVETTTSRWSSSPRPDLPWRYTPAGPGTDGRPRPWLALVVVDEAAEDIVYGDRTG